MELSPVLPHDVVLERGPVLRKALRALPFPLLQALSYALDEHADELSPGSLYNSKGGGCAIGVMLREMFPAAFPTSRFSWWRRRISNRSVYDDFEQFAREFPRLFHIELVFDRTICLTRERHPELDQDLVSRATGQWLAAECEAELDRRRRDAYARWAAEGHQGTPAAEPAEIPALLAAGRAR